MRQVCTRSGSILSRLIRFIGTQLSSHYAIHLETLGVVLHSNLLGVHIEQEGDFLPNVEIVFEKRTATSRAQEFEVLTAFLPLLGKRYDLGALLFDGFAVVRKRLFGVALPEHNAWGARDKFLCTELYDHLPDWIVPSDSKLDNDGMVTPDQLAKVAGMTFVLMGGES